MGNTPGNDKAGRMSRSHVRRSASSRSHRPNIVEVGEETILFSAPTPTGQIAVTQTVIEGYGPKVRGLRWLFLRLVWVFS